MRLLGIYLWAFLIAAPSLARAQQDIKTAVSTRWLISPLVGLKKSTHFETASSSHLRREDDPCAAVLMDSLPKAVGTEANRQLAADYLKRLQETERQLGNVRRTDGLGIEASLERAESEPGLSASSIQLKAYGHERGLISWESPAPKPVAHDIYKDAGAKKVAIDLFKCEISPEAVSGFLQGRLHALEPGRGPAALPASFSLPENPYAAEVPTEGGIHWSEPLAGASSQ